MSTTRALHTTIANTELRKTYLHNVRTSMLERHAWARARLGKKKTQMEIAMHAATHVNGAQH